MKKNCFFILVFILFFSSCKSQPVKRVLLSDRHGLSYYPVKEFCDKNNCRTLVLFDFHNDVNPYKKEITSFNWVGKLIENETIEKVYWICLYSLSKKELEEKQNWIKINCNQKTSVMKNKIYESFEILGFTDFVNKKVGSNFVVSLDLDLVTLDENSPNDFIVEICDWIKNSNSNLVTSCFSQSYQTNPQKAYKVLYDFIKNTDSSYEWYLINNDFEEINESREDISAWENFNEHPEIFYFGENKFYRGDYFWICIPDFISSELLSKKISSYNDERNGKQIIKNWENNRKNITQVFSANRFISLLEKIRSFERINKEDLKKDKNIQEICPKNFGISVSFCNKKSTILDYTIYEGIKEEELDYQILSCYDKFINSKEYKDYLKRNELLIDRDRIFIKVEVFSNFTQVSNWFDFIPGANSFLIVTNNSAKYYKALVCAENNYSKDKFLDYIFVNSNLSKFSVNNSDIKIYRCDSVFYCAPI